MVSRKLENLPPTTRLRILPRPGVTSSNQGFRSGTGIIAVVIIYQRRGAEIFEKACKSKHMGRKVAP